MYAMYSKKKQRKSDGLQAGRKGKTVIKKRAKGKYIYEPAIGIKLKG
jgi:hypothetical protein